MGVLDDDLAGYLRFHLEEIGCRVCQANVDDLRREHAVALAGQAASTRRRKYFESSVGLLKSP